MGLIAGMFLLWTMYSIPIASFISMAIRKGIFPWITFGKWLVDFYLLFLICTLQLMNSLTLEKASPQDGLPEAPTPDHLAKCLQQVNQSKSRDLSLTRSLTGKSQRDGNCGIRWL